MALTRVSLSCSARLLPSPLLQSFLRPFSSSTSPLRSSRRRSSPIAAAFSQASQSPHAVREGQVTEAPMPSSTRPWKPTCLYYTQGKCTMVRLLPSLHLLSRLVFLKRSSSYPILRCTSWGQIYTIIDVMCVTVANSARMVRILQVDTGRRIRICLEILASKKQSFGLRSKPL
jgi:hypothetical protein